MAPGSAAQRLLVHAGLQVLFWDVRVDKLLKKGNKRMDETELVWRPMHTVHLLSVQGMMQVDIKAMIFTSTLDVITV